MQPSTRPRHLVLGIGIEHDERILDAPVGGVGHVRHAREAVEARCCPCRCSATSTRTRALAQVLGRSRTTPRSGRRRAFGGIATRLSRPWRRGSASSRPVAGGAPLLDLAQAMAHRLDQQAPAASGSSRRSSCRYGLRSTTQMSPSTSNSIRAERPVRRSPRSSVRSCHIVVAQQADHDLAIGERRVVVRDLAQARRVCALSWSTKASVTVFMQTASLTAAAA